MSVEFTRIGFSVFTVVYLHAYEPKHKHLVAYDKHLVAYDLVLLLWAATFCCAPESLGSKLKYQLSDSPEGMWLG